MNLTSQIILLAFLIFILLLIIGLSIKYYCYFKRQVPKTNFQTNQQQRIFIINTMESPVENNVETVHQQNNVEYSLNFQIQLNHQQGRLEFNNKKIIYSFNNQQKKIIYEYQMDQNFNQEYRKYEKNNDRIQNLDFNYNRIQDQNKANYFYNTQITNEQSLISYLDALVNYLNFETIQSQIKKQRQNKLILFAPSTIFQIENQQFNYEPVKCNFQKFFFYFQEIDYGIAQICSSVFFVVQKFQSDKYILVQVKFQEPREIIIHDQDQGQEQLQHNDYTLYVDILNNLFQLQIGTPSICQECKVDKSYNVICIGNEALKKSMMGNFLEDTQNEQSFNFTFEQFIGKINQRININ